MSWRWASQSNRDPSWSQPRILPFHRLKSEGRGEVRRWRRVNTLRHSVEGHSLPTIVMQLTGFNGVPRTVSELLLTWPLRQTVEHCLTVRQVSHWQRWDTGRGPGLNPKAHRCMQEPGLIKTLRCEPWKNGWIRRSGPSRQWFGEIRRRASCRTRVDGLLGILLTYPPDTIPTPHPPALSPPLHPFSASTQPRLEFLWNFQQLEQWKYAVDGIPSMYITRWSDYAWCPYFAGRTIDDVKTANPWRGWHRIPWERYIYIEDILKIEATATSRVLHAISHTRRYLEFAGVLFLLHLIRVYQKVRSSYDPKVLFLWAYTSLTLNA